MKEREGDYLSAINWYLKGGLPARAANVVNNHNFAVTENILETIAGAL